MTGMQFQEMKNVKEMEIASNTEAVASLREVIDGFDSLQSMQEDEKYHWEVDLWDVPDEYRDLGQRMAEFVRENPGRSYNALFNYFKSEGFFYRDILETYNILVYDKKILLRLNVGTAASPRYAHFVLDFFVQEPVKDALFEILGPIEVP